MRFEPAFIGILAVVLSVFAILLIGYVITYRRYTRLRRRFHAHLAVAAPEIGIEHVSYDNVGLQLDVLGVPMTADLVSLSRRRAPRLTETEWFNRIVADIRAKVPTPNIPPFALVQDRILPLLKPTAYADIFEGYPPPLRLVRRPMAPGVVVTYVIAGIHQMTSVLAKALEVWTVTPEALHELAIANLRTQTARVLAEVDGPRLVYEHLDGYDAARILAADLIVPPGVTDPVIAIPEETVLLVAPGADETRLQAEAVARHARAARPLSADVFRPRAGEPGAVDPQNARR